MAVVPPKLFVSYSHDSELHKGWVLTLATRLMANGVDVILDQWDLGLGGDLPRFMETGLVGANRVLAICTAAYVAKANAGTGGVGYEKMILTAQVMANVTSDRIIPLIRENHGMTPVPTFLSSRVYIDFRDDIAYEARYGELVREIHGQQLKPRPVLGDNPFAAKFVFATPVVSFGPERYVAPTLTGTVKFDYSNNDGCFVLGVGDMAFETKWSGGSNSEIHAYSDRPSIHSMSLATGVKDIEDIKNASAFDPSSRTRTPRVGEIVIWQNTSGYFLATKIESLSSRLHGAAVDEITFSYVIQPNRTSTF